MGTKPKTPQPETPNEVQERDCFSTPRYGTELILPFIPEGLKVIWEPCCGEDERMAKVLFPWLGNEHGTSGDVIATDIIRDPKWNIFTYTPEIDNLSWDCAITNPPFSLKRKVWDRLVSLGKPFALLIPADYSSWIIDAIRKGAEKVIPTRRIDYLTPNILSSVSNGETWIDVRKFFDSRPDKEIDEIIRKPYSQVKDNPWVVAHMTQFRTAVYNTIDDCPEKLLAKYSTSQFHSMYLCWKFNIGRTETFVDLSQKDKLRIL